MLTQAADGAATAIEGVPAWLVWTGGIVLTPVVGVLVAYLRRLLKVEEPTERAPVSEAQTGNQGTPVTPAQTHQAPITAQQPTADPEIALIATMVERLHLELASTRAQITEANRAHTAEMAAADERHRSSMAAVMERLADREETISQLRATIDTLTGRRQQ